MQTSGDWKYRVINGVAECWTRKSSLAGNKDNDNLFSLALPSGLFAADPVANVNINVTGDPRCTVNLINATTTEVSCYYSLVYGKGKTIVAYIHVIGQAAIS